MAPEVILAKGYNSHVDLWSLGTILYEMVFGILPYGENCIDPYKVYEEILKGDLHFPVKLKHRTKGTGLI